MLIYHVPEVNFEGILGRFVLIKRILMGKMGSANTQSALIFVVLIDNKAQIIKAIYHFSGAYRIRGY